MKGILFIFKIRIFHEGDCYKYLGYIPTGSGDGEYGEELTDSINLFLQGTSMQIEAATFRPNLLESIKGNLDGPLSDSNAKHLAVFIVLNYRIYLLHLFQRIIMK